MTPGWIGFVCGLFIGAVGGVLITALCVFYRFSGDDINRMFNEAVPPRNALPPRLPRT